MTLKDALTILGIEDYSERIFNSNSTGELFHLADYVMLAEWLNKEPRLDKKWFREWFEVVVGLAEKWKRPASVYQHMPRLLEETFGA